MARCCVFQRDEMFHNSSAAEKIGSLLLDAACCILHTGTNQHRLAAAENAARQNNATPYTCVCADAIHWCCGAARGAQLFIVK